MSFSTTAVGASVSADADAQPRYKVKRKPNEEGLVTNLLSMLTAIPRVHLGIKYVPSFSTALLEHPCDKHMPTKYRRDRKGELTIAGPHTQPQNPRRQCTPRRHVLWVFSLCLTYSHFSKSPCSFSFSLPPSVAKHRSGPLHLASKCGYVNASSLCKVWIQQPKTS